MNERKIEIMLRCNCDDPSFILDELVVTDIKNKICSLDVRVSCDRCKTTLLVMKEFVSYSKRHELVKLFTETAVLGGIKPEIVQEAVKQL